MMSKMRQFYIKLKKSRGHRALTLGLFIPLTISLVHCEGSQYNSAQGQNPLSKKNHFVPSNNGSVIAASKEGTSQVLSDKDIFLFQKRFHSRLADYKPHFIKAGSQYNLPWELVAAISYQESQWDPQAKSFTGVQGLMQITKSTAKDLGIEDIHNAEENIFGGAKYLKQLISLMPDHLSDTDRIILALAAYNLGIGHLFDAFKIATSLGKNPYDWNHLKKILPKLSDETFYRQTQFGSARGNETVAFVERTKAFYNCLIQKNR
jgi:membrane-bound lytic murein transglycosylase F